MTTDTIQKIQACLTVCRNGDEKRKIIDVELLLKRHKAESVISLLKRLLKEKQKTLVTLIDTDESRFEIDEIIGTMFRLHLAIRRLEREKEEVKEHVPELNKEQEEAASFIEGICAVIAVPGSGKTRTMMERIGKLVKDNGIAPESVLGLTFTRNAAEEMRSRLVPVLGDQATRVMLSTIHSFCYWVLRCEGKVFEILSGKEQLIFMRNILKQLRIKNVSLGMALNEISLAKNNLITADEFRSLYEGDKTMLKIAEVYEAYDREKAKKFLLDFDDLLFEVYQLFSSHSAIKDKYSERFQHVLVDEFQDTNPVQLELLKCLISSSANGGSFWVCGDDWQSIYSFTGASIGNILNFSTSFEGSRVFILNLNYRSTPQIFKACQNLIQHNVRKIDKLLKTENEAGDQVIVLEASNEEGEGIEPGS